MKPPRFPGPFNPAQAGFAQQLSNASAAEVKLYDDDFEDFARRADLPDFDYIGLHGIWSWVSDESRRTIIEFIRKKLKVGGVLYISYNTLPGWATFAPMRHLMTEHAQVLGAGGQGLVNRIEGAMDFAEKLLATNPNFSRANPLTADRLKKMKEHDRHYLAHEYFNRDWHPMYFSTMAEWLKGAKVQFACSANYLDHIPAVNLTPEQQAFLNGIPDPTFRETSRDFVINQQFRKDYWIKGTRKMNQVERLEAIQSVRVLLTSDRAAVSLKVTGAIGEATLTETIYGPILDFLADHKIKTLGQIEQTLRSRGITYAQILQAIVLLVSAGHVTLAQEEQVISKVKKHTDKLNTYICQKAQGSSDIGYLTSPVSGGGVAVGRFQQLFLLAISQGKKLPHDWAQFAAQVLAAQGQKLVKEGVAMQSLEEGLSALKTEAEIFAEKQLPILKALQIA